MTTRTEDLTYLSRRAHAEALAKREPVPADWRELSHLPMWRTDGVPIFDGTRMRPDQIEDTILALERYLGVKARQADAYTAVDDFLRSYAKWGVREQDVVLQTGVSRSSVKRILRTRVEAGELIVRDEKTRGDGSRRKRYFLADHLDQMGYDPAELGQLMAVGLNLRHEQAMGMGDGDTGIRHHGTAVQALTCGCTSCGWAFEEGLAATLRSAARRRGDRSAAFQAGLEAKRMRREKQLYLDRKAIEAAGGWVP